MRNLHNVLHSSCTNLYSHQQHTGVFFPPHPCLCLLLLVFLIIVILTGVKWYLVVFLVCISPMMSDVEHLFMYLLAIFMSAWEKCVFKYSAHLLGCFFPPTELYYFFIYFRYWCLIRYMICKYFSLSFCWWFPLLWKCFSLM